MSMAASGTFAYHRKSDSTLPSFSIPQNLKTVLSLEPPPSISNTNYSGTRSPIAIDTDSPIPSKTSKSKLKTSRNEKNFLKLRRQKLTS